MKAKIRARRPKKLSLQKTTTEEFDYNRIHDKIPKKITSRKTRKKAPRSAANPKKVVTRGYVVPSWFKGIKASGGHGATTAQKKLWKLVSISVRVEDFEKYNAKCVSCPARLERWQDGQAAHYRAWSISNGFFKYERTNLALSCPHCNRVNDGPIGREFGDELMRRYGTNHLEWIAKENEAHRGEKMEEWQIVEKAEPLYLKYGKYL